MFVGDTGASPATAIAPKGLVIADSNTTPEIQSSATRARQGRACVHAQSAFPRGAEGETPTEPTTSASLRPRSGACGDSRSAKSDELGPRRVVPLLPVREGGPVVSSASATRAAGRARRPIRRNRTHDNAYLPPDLPS